MCVCIEFVIPRRHSPWSIDRYRYVQYDARQRWVSVSEQFGGVHSLHVWWSVLIVCRSLLWVSFLSMWHIIRDLMCKCVYVHWLLCKRVYINWVGDINNSSLVIYKNGYVCVCVCESYDMRVQRWNTCECIEFVVSLRLSSWTVGRYASVCIYVLVWDVRYHIACLMIPYV